MRNFDFEKFKTLVHYICFKSDAEKLGAIKLNKILWFSDVINFLVKGEPITGEVYIKRQYGPVPKHILAALEQLQNESKLAVTDKSVYGYSKREYNSLSEPDVELLTSTEIRIVDDVVDTITNGHTAHSISELTHNDIWEMAQIGEEIPHNTILVANLGEIDEHDMEWSCNYINKMAA